MSQSVDFKGGTPKTRTLQMIFINQENQSAKFLPHGSIKKKNKYLLVSASQRHNMYFLLLGLTAKTRKIKDIYS